MLEINGVSKRYGQHHALRQVSFTVPSGSIFGLLGPNGAGKSTLIRIINKILEADEGRVSLNGQEVTSKHVSQMGYLPEERGLYKKMKVGEHVIYLARLKGLSKQDAHKRTHEWFERMHVSDWWNKKVETLSKGMQQKIQFISTVLHEPRLLILDEPFSGFDPVNAEAVKEELERLKQQGTTIMLSTHRMESVEELCDHIAMIHKAEKVIDGQVKDVKRTYSENIFEVIYIGDKLPESNWPQHGLIKHESRDDQHHLQLKLDDDDASLTSNQLLQGIMQERRVVGFREVLPTIEEIFVRIAKS